jgi:hypothetical protein
MNCFPAAIAEPPDTPAFSLSRPQPVRFSVIKIVRAKEALELDEDLNLDQYRLSQAVLLVLPSFAALSWSMPQPPEAAAATLLSRLDFHQSGNPKINPLTRWSSVNLLMCSSGLRLAARVFEGKGLKD